MPWPFPFDHNPRRPRRPHHSPFDDLNQFSQDELGYVRGGSEFLLDGLNAWAGEIRLLVAECNAKYNAAMDKRDNGQIVEAINSLVLC